MSTEFDWKNGTVSIQKVLDLLEQHLGSTSEVVYHDLTLPYDHTIVDIRNGDITGRSLGGCGSNLGLEVMRGVAKDGDRFNYITHAKNGKILRSTTIYLQHADRVVGALCINTDISEAIRLENLLHTYSGYQYQNKGDAECENGEFFASNVNELLDHFMKIGQRNVGVPAPLMNREEKLRFLRYLDEKGAFLISKSGDHVCAFLGISKYTLYNCLEEIRNDSLPDAQKNNRSDMNVSGE